MIDDFKRPDERKPVRLDNLRDELPQPQVSRPSSYETPVSPAETPAEPPFRPPEQVGMNADRHPGQLFLPPLENIPEIEAHTSKPRRRFWPPRKPDLSKKQWIIIGTVLILLVGASTAVALALTRDKPEPVVVKKAPVKVIPPPPPILSPLTGLAVTKEQQARPVTGVMIENSTNARPQSGLDQAGVVVEAIAEAGITRFLALYQDNNPAVVGPIRSARPYYLDFAMTFDAGYAHVGGSPDALQRIKELGVRDLDQFFNSAAYRRDSKRFAPHNVYSSLDQLLGLSAAKGWTSSTFTPLSRKAKEEPSAAPTARSIDLAISSGKYNVHYDYDPAKNAYLRSMGGEVHIDNETRVQLAPKVVVALGMPYSLMADGYHSQYQTTGTGNMIIFQDGIVIPGTWTKTDIRSQFIFKDAAGAEIKLNPGQTWFTLLGDISKATYAP